MIDITGIPLYDGMIEGFLFIPSMISDSMQYYGVYNIGFWFGISAFTVIGLRLIFGWD